jgi:DNA gyrase subunit A
MGRDTSGVRGMDVSGKDNYVLAMDVARPGQDLLVVTENGYGKRTAIDEYRLTSRGAKGVKTINFTENKGLLAAALVVKEHQELVFISQNGIVQRTGVRGINRYGRASQGVRLMNLREDDSVSAVALVVEDSPDVAADVAEELPSVDAGDTTTQPDGLAVSGGTTEAGPQAEASTDGATAAASADESAVADTADDDAGSADGDPDAAAGDETADGDPDDTAE